MDLRTLTSARRPRSTRHERHPLHSGLARRLASRHQRRTAYMLVGGAIAATSVGVGLVLARRAQRVKNSLPPDVSLGQAGRAAAGDAVAVIREGYRETSSRENAILNMLAAFLATFALARTTTWLIASDRAVWPLRNVVVGRRHIHHFVPGIALSLLAGTVSIGVRDQDLDRWLAIPFGAGAALILDESALLLELEDVYWSEEGVLSLQFGVACAALLGVAALVGHLLQRGAPAISERPGAAQRTPIRSTTNTSVSSGPMTPPAPRLP